MHALCSLCFRSVGSVAVTLLRPSSAGVGYDTLLIKRGKAPNYGHWAFPGGSLEPGETIRQCAERELREETAIAVAATEPFYATEVLPGPGEGGHGTQYVLIHVLGEPVGEEVSAAVRAGDDAMEARWMAVEMVRRMEAAMAERGEKEAAVSVGGEDTFIVPNVSTVLDRAILLYQRLFTRQ